MQTVVIVAIIILVCLIIWKYYISRTMKVAKSSEKYGFKSPSFPGLGAEGFAGRGFGCNSFATKCE